MTNHKFCADAIRAASYDPAYDATNAAVDSATYAKVHSLTYMRPRLDTYQVWEDICNALRDATEYAKPAR